MHWNTGRINAETYVNNSLTSHDLRVCKKEKGKKKRGQNKLMKHIFARCLGWICKGITQLQSVKEL